MENEGVPLLSVRRGVREPFELKEGVPPHIASQLYPWLSEEFRSRRRLAARIAAAIEYPFRESGYFVKDLQGHDDDTLDVVDLLLRYWGSDDFLAHQNAEAIRILTQLLKDGHSVWTVNTDPLRLDRRVSTVALQQYRSAVGVDDRASEFLSSAWQLVFSRNPDPSHAWSQATKALEARLGPIAVPNNPAPSFGQLGKALRAKPEKWDADMPGDDNTSRVLAFADLLDRFPFAPDRHGRENVPEIEIGTARSVVLIATTILEILHQKGLRRL